MLARQHVRERVHIRFDEALEFEHYTRAALRVGRRPAGLRRPRRGDDAIEQGRIAERDLRLHAAIIGVEHVALTGAASG